MYRNVVTIGISVAVNHIQMNIHDIIMVGIFVGTFCSLLEWHPSADSITEGILFT